MVSVLIVKQTEMIKATDATFTASKKMDNPLDCLIFFINGFNSPTRMKEGKKIAIVDINAPPIPLI